MKGFTLIELLLVMGLVAVLSVFTTINLIRPQTKASLDITITTLVSDLRSQQTKAMIGDTGISFGIQFNPQNYVLLNDSFSVSLDSNLSLTTTFPSSQVNFARVSGEVSGFVDGSNTITVSSGGESKTITVNRYGVVNVQ